MLHIVQILLVSSVGICWYTDWEFISFEQESPTPLIVLPCTMSLITYATLFCFICIVVWRCSSSSVENTALHTMHTCCTVGSPITPTTSWFITGKTNGSSCSGSCARVFANCFLLVGRGFHSVLASLLLLACKIETSNEEFQKHKEVTLKNYRFKVKMKEKKIESKKDF